MEHRRTARRLTSPPGSLLAGLLLAGLCLGTAGWAQETLRSDFLVFPTVDNSVAYVDRAGDQIDHRHLNTAIDFFFSGERGQLTLLAEYLVGGHGRHDDAHLERLQLGWRASDQTAPVERVWVGRMHNPIGYWNTQYHHGTYLETAAHRPAFLHYEEDGGIFPMHLTGVNVEGRFFGHGVYTLLFGAAPILNNNQLHTFTVEDGSAGNHKLATTLRLDLRQNDRYESVLGVFASTSEITSDNLTLGDIRQTVIGGHALLAKGAWRTFGSIFLANHRFSAGGSDPLSYAYVQTEYAATPRATPYLRLMGSNDSDNDPYLAAFSETYQSERSLGVRFDFRDHQALKVDLTRFHTLTEHFDQVCLQWSAVF